MSTSNEWINCGNGIEIRFSSDEIPSSPIVHETISNQDITDATAKLRKQVEQDGIEATATRLGISTRTLESLI